ncbi:MAG: threonine/serine exporter family protein [Rothia sp. (in: high G+C Gram-positive bacteria)]|nr:threonine/serine exporter family protein [Rothia sp. (in: high G+C Gram-positive bacteria)]
MTEVERDHQVELPQASYPANTADGQLVGQGYRRSVKSSLRTLISSQQAMTAPLRGVARVAQRQFAASAQVQQDQRVRLKEETRNVLNFSLRLAETMFRCGADAADVDAAIVAVCARYGIHDVEVDIGYQSIRINYVSEFDEAAGSSHRLPLGEQGLERFSHNLVRVVRSSAENYSSLEATYRLIHRITGGQLSRTRAEQELAALVAEKKPYSPALLLVWNLVMAVAFTLGVGGSWRAALTSFFVFIAVNFSLVWVSRFALPAYFSLALGSGIITYCALWVSSTDSWFFQQGFVVSAPHIVAAGLMMLLPTFRLVSAMQDALHGFPLTAAGKFVVTGANFTGIIAGIGVALTLINLVDQASLDVSRTVFDPPPLWINVAGMTLGSVMVAAAWQGVGANLWWSMLVSLTGQGAYYGLSAVTAQEVGRINVLVGALTVGLLGAIIGHRLHTPAAIYYIPGMMFMLPGLAIFRSAYALLSGGDVLSGVYGLSSAGITVLMLATGIVLGTYLVDYLVSRVGGQKRKVRLAAS